MSVINIAQKLSLFNEFWSPKIIGEFNNQKIQVVKLKGEFVWHSHEAEDEMFLVIKGILKINFRDKVETINEGEFITIPHGVEHKPEAQEEVHIEVPSNYSREVTDFISCCLQFNVENRHSVEQLITHSWVQRYNNTESDKALEEWIHLVERLRQEEKRKPVLSLQDIGIK